MEDQSVEVGEDYTIEDVVLALNELLKSRNLSLDLSDGQTREGFHTVTLTDLEQ